MLHVKQGGIKRGLKPKISQFRGGRSTTTKAAWFMLHWFFFNSFICWALRFSMKMCLAMGLWLTLICLQHYHINKTGQRHSWFSVFRTIRSASLCSCCHIQKGKRDFKWGLQSCRNGLIKNMPEWFYCFLRMHAKNYCFLSLFQELFVVHNEHLEARPALVSSELMSQ